LPNNARTTGDAAAAIGRIVVYLAAGREVKVT